MVLHFVRHGLMLLVLCVFVFAQEAVQTTDAPASSIDNAAAMLDQLAAPSGPIKILVARPNNFDYKTSAKTSWVAAICRDYLRVRLDMSGQVFVIPADVLSIYLPAYDDFNRRISKQNYLTVAKKMNATHVLYLESQVLSDRKATLHATVISLADTKKEKQFQVQVDVNAFAESLNSGLQQIIQALGAEKISASSEKKDAFLGNDAGRLKRLGEVIVGEEGQSYFARAEKCRAIAKEDKACQLALFNAAGLYEYAGRFDLAQNSLGTLLSQSGSTYPKLYLQQSVYDRKMKNFIQAQQDLKNATGNEVVAMAVMLKNGQIFEDMGNKDEARSQYESYLTANPGDPSPYFQLAGLSLANRQGSGADNYIEKLSQQSGEKTSDLYFLLGEKRWREHDTTVALAAYEAGIRLDGENAKQCLVYATLLRSVNKPDEAATAFLKVFNLNQSTYRNYLDTAANLFVITGKKQEAKDAYRAYLRSKDDPRASIACAELEYKDGNCVAVKELLSPIAKSEIDVKVGNMLAKCSPDNVAPVITLRQNIPIVLPLNGRYEEPGATAIDNVDGNCTGRIVVSGKVDTRKLGTYIIAYTVTDKAGNSARAERSVTVTSANDNSVTVFNQGNTSSQGSLNKGVYFTLAISSGALAVVAAGAGYYFESGLTKKLQAYRTATSDIEQLHNDLSNAVLFRNICYGVAGVAGAACAITITIPIVIDSPK